VPVFSHSKIPMEITPKAQPIDPAKHRRDFSRFRLYSLISISTLLVLILIYSWITRDAMANLPFLGKPSAAVTNSTLQKSLVDLRPWQTAQALAPLAVTAEEMQFAREAERLADHEVDQAFASALRLANARQRTLTGEALVLSQKVDQIQQLVKDDQAQVQRLAPATAPNPAIPSPNSDDLEVAKAQLGLDQDELDDAQGDLARASGDERTRIQQELAAHEAAMAKYDAHSTQAGERAVLSAQRYKTLSHLISGWFNQRSRHKLIQQATQQAKQDIADLTTLHNALESTANSNKSTSDQSATGTSRLDSIKRMRDQRQILAIYDDRIQTQQQLANVYLKWSAQLLLQHRIVLHLILQDLALIAFALILTMLFDALVGHLLERPTLDRRRMQTLRTILQLGIQILGGLAVIFIIFGTPSQMPTILGLATAGLTVVLQDFILAFFGWFVLMGKSGIRVGDTVEINSVSGQVTEIGLFRTALLETGNWTDTGHPTGRRVTFINSFAIRGQYFNFSTTGQWMWDEISVSIPTSEDTYSKIEQIHQVVLKQTEKDARTAEDEWKRSARQYGLSQFSAIPAVNLRPAASGVDIIVRYITRAVDRFETRNRLYQSVLDVLQNPQPTAELEAKTIPA
jgi:small-conductance mechanosensitive channel